MKQRHEGDNRVPFIFFLSLIVTLLFATVSLAMQVYALFKYCGVTSFMMALRVTLNS